MPDDVEQAPASFGWGCDLFLSVAERRLACLVKDALFAELLEGRADSKNGVLDTLRGRDNSPFGEERITDIARRRELVGAGLLRAPVFGVDVLVEPPGRTGPEAQHQVIVDRAVRAADKLVRLDLIQVDAPLVPFFKVFLIIRDGRRLFGVLALDEILQREVGFCQDLKGLVNLRMRERVVGAGELLA